MSDYLATCNSGELRTDPKTFQATWCARCRRPDCDLAVWAKTDPMAHRQATWREHFFGMPLADTQIPKYAQIAGLNFQDLLHKSVKLEVSQQRGDWSVPEIEITDGRVVQAPDDTARQVEDAVKQLAKASGRVTEAPAPEEEPEVPEERAVAPTPKEPVAPISRATPLPTEALGAAKRSGNTPDPGEVMVGGASLPPSKADQPKPPADPWAAPPKPKVTVVKTGATITFGSDGKGKVVDD